MAIIKSETVALKATDAEVFEFLSDFNNFEKLMPEDKIKDWLSDQETCSFQIKGLAKIGMRIDELTPNKLVKAVSHGKNPFDFTLNVHIQTTGENSCESHMVFDGNMNSFLEMMASKPLTNFFNLLAAKLKELKG